MHHPGPEVTEFTSRHSCCCFGWAQTRAERHRGGGRLWQFLVLLVSVMGEAEPSPRYRTLNALVGTGFPCSATWTIWVKCMQRTWMKWAQDLLLTERELEVLSNLKATLIPCHSEHCFYWAWRRWTTDADSEQFPDGKSASHTVLASFHPRLPPHCPIDRGLSLQTARLHPFLALSLPWKFPKFPHP